MSYLKIVRHAGGADVLPIHRERGITAGNIARALSRSERAPLCLALNRANRQLHICPIAPGKGADTNLQDARHTDAGYICPWCGQQLEPPQPAGADDVPR